MIDCHCHLEEAAYDADRDEVIRACKEQGLKALITVCADPGDWDRTQELAGRHKGFVFICASVHPIYIDRVTPQEVDDYFNVLRENTELIVAVGETGADYFHVREADRQMKQRDLFRRHIRLAKELDKPVVVHCRDAFQDVISILEEEGAKRVMLHLFGGNKFMDRVIANGWWISVGPILLRSKAHKKIVRDMPLEKIMLETDSPWFGPNGERNTPASVIPVAERIAEIKNTDVKSVSDITDRNAVEFFRLAKL